MRWNLSHQADKRALPLANRHYSRKNPESPQFGLPGKHIVLLTPEADALWISQWPKPTMVQHEWKDAWYCALFRNESPHLSSELIREAIAAIRWHWSPVPRLGMVTFVDPTKVRKKRDFGRCFIRAGFREVGLTKKRKLIAFLLAPEEMPEPAKPGDLIQ